MRPSPSRMRGPSVTDDAPSFPPLHGEGFDGLLEPDFKFHNHEGT